LEISKKEKESSSHFAFKLMKNTVLRILDLKTGITDVKFCALLDTEGNIIVWKDA
jgi:hypothetical protein